jgi:hypothetical protein
MPAEWLSHLNACLATGLSPYLHLNTAEPHSLPTLMPRWDALQASTLPKPIHQLVAAGGQQDSADNAIRALVVIHAFYPDRLRPLLEKLLATESFSGILITTDTVGKVAIIEALLREMCLGSTFCAVEVVENHGRDVLPFWQMLLRYGEHYDVFLKLHLKRSALWDEQWKESLVDHAGDAGWAWTEHNFRCLIPSSPEEFRLLIRWMAEDGIGALYPEPFIGVQTAGWGSDRNLFHASRLLSAAGVSDLYLLLPLIFPAGNMFWGVVKNFLPLATIFVEKEDYPPEPLADDGTFLHAMERSYSALLSAQRANAGILFSPPRVSSNSCLYGLTVDLNHPLGAKESMEGPSSCEAPNDSQAIWIYMMHLKEVVLQRERADLLARELKGVKKMLSTASRPLVSRILKRLFR